ncbi:putative uncharacterized protein [Firmicutes bacterium CAG:449]|nr:putative uncharacterized protein [Firmicutes bacterium CAG:449]
MQKIMNFFSKHQVIKSILKWVLLYIVIWILYDVLYKLGRSPNDNLQTIRTMMVVPIVYALGKGCYLYGKKELDEEKLATLLLIIGFTLRIGYAFYTGSSTRQHDVEMYNNGNLNLSGQGHFSYTYIIYSTGMLPQEMRWQFYHPPLWHSLCALFMHIYEFFEGTNDVATLYNANMILSSFVGCLTLYYIKKIIFYFSENKYYRIIALLLLAFHPQFFIMAGWMNNEGLSFMFMIMSFYYGLLFNQNRKWLDIILCGVSLGLAAMSKVSAALICAPLLMIFIYDFVKDVKNKTYKKTLLQGLTFIGIVAPLSLWFIVRNIVKFGITSVGVPGMNPYKSSLGVVSYSLWQRFGIPNIFNLNEGLWCILRPNNNNYLDYNVWLYTFKCSVFGEYSFWQGEIFAYMLLITNILVIIFALYCMIYVLIKNIKSFNNILMLLTYIITIISYIAFQIIYPLTCTQDFRYMTLVLIPSAYFVGQYFSLENKNKITIKFKYLSLALIFSFCLSSVLFYISCR